MNHETGDFLFANWRFSCARFRRFCNTVEHTEGMAEHRRESPIPSLGSLSSLSSVVLSLSVVHIVTVYAIPAYGLSYGTLMLKSPKQAAKPVSAISRVSRMTTGMKNRQSLNRQSPVS